MAFPGLRLVVALLMAGSAFSPAPASGAVTGDWGAYAVLASRLDVPLPDAYVHRSDCPGGTAAACSSPVSDDVWVADWALDKFTLAHELGHQFDRQFLTDADREWLRRVMHAPGGEWIRRFGADEWFADYYADCATRAWRRGSSSSAAYAPLPPPTRLARVCLAIRAIRTRLPAPTASGS
jgi:hypothetical protein